MSNITNFFPKREDFFYPIEEYFNSIFDDFFNTKNLSSLKSKVNFPKLDIYTTDKTWNVEVAIPGMKPEDISVEIEENNKDKILVISGKFEKEEDSSKTFYSIKELRKSSFSRKVLLPENVSGEPEATIKNGILKLIWELPEKETVKNNIKKISVKETN